MALTGRALIASRTAKFFKDGDLVNLGIGVPTMCVNYLPEGVDLWLEAEIGIVGCGRPPNGRMQTPDALTQADSPPASSKAAASFPMTCPSVSFAVDMLTPRFWAPCRSMAKAT